MTKKWRLGIREKEHMEGRGSKWTKRFPPIKLLEVWNFLYKKDAHEFEIQKTEELLRSYGIDSTRGGLCNYGQEGGYNLWIRAHLKDLIPI